MVFWREVARSPRGIGSLFPSGRSLGRAVVREVLAGSPGFVIEIGAGTGAITGALLAQRDKFGGLTVLEKSPRMAALLAQRYPETTIRVACASELADQRFPRDVPLTIVSSLPFRSLPARDVASICAMIERLKDHHAGFRFIQYSYFGRVPFPSEGMCMEWRQRRTVFNNMPPATIWVLQDRQAHA